MMANNAIKKMPAAAGGPQEEQQIEQMLDRLDEVHLQASLPCQSRCHCPNGVVISDLDAAEAASLGASADAGASHGQTPNA
jgi:hypothetical protein